MKTINAVVEFKNALAEGKVNLYYKIGKTFARKAKEGESIDTVVDGKLELTAKAKKGDYVVVGPAGEEYLVSEEKFTARYKPSNLKSIKKGFSVFIPTGTCYAFEYMGENAHFQHSRGQMLIETGDYLASTSKTNYEDVYRIERKIFDKTYKLKN
jgi:hypothetical protein